MPIKTGVLHKALEGVCESYRKNRTGLTVYRPKRKFIIAFSGKVEEVSRITAETTDSIAVSEQENAFIFRAEDGDGCPSESFLDLDDFSAFALAGYEEMEDLEEEGWDKEAWLSFKDYE